MNINGTDDEDSVDLSGKTITLSGDAVKIDLGEGADTITASDAVDYIVNTSAFADADTVNDFTSGTDKLYFDFTKSGAANKFDGDNKLASEYLKTSKLQVFLFSVGDTGAKIDKLTTLSKKVSTAKTTTSANVLSSKKWLKGNGLEIKSNKIFLTKTDGNMVTISKLKASAKVTGGATKTKAALFFYDNDDGVLKMYGSSNNTNSSNDTAIDKKYSQALQG